MSSRAEIILESEALDDGESTRIVCPECGGGSSREKSLNLSKNEGTVLWNCHRASCEERGAAGDRGNFVRTKQPRQERQRRITPYEGELSYLSDEWKDYMRDALGWDAQHHEVGRAMYAVADDRVAYPIYSPLGIRRGWVLRSYDPSCQTKALTRMDMDEPHLSWYRTQNNNSCVVVEDIPSAVRASRYTDAVALCGTGCGPDYAMEIAAYYKNVVWALDADATGEAIKLMRKYATLFESSSVMVLERDFKNEEETALWKLLS